MFGFSFGELLVISLVTLVAVGPQKLPGMLKTMGQWARKLRKMTMDVRAQTGIDEMLRAEGIQISELRSLMRGYHAPAPVPVPAPAPVAPAPRYEDPYADLEPDPTREYPPEGADSYGALPDDLLEPPSSTEVADAPGAPDAIVTAESRPPEPELVPALAAEEPVAAEPVAEPVANAAPTEAAAVEAPAVEAAPVPALVEASSLAEATAPAPRPARSGPPPPPSSRAANAQPARPSGTPPPPPRRTAPPRPEPSTPLASKPDVPAPVPPSPGTPNGNG